MNKNPIMGFYYNNECNRKSTNYPGLIDAIYILVYRPDLGPNDEFWKILQTGRNSNGNDVMFSAEHNFLDVTHYPNYGEVNDKSDVDAYVDPESLFTRDVLPVLPGGEVKNNVLDYQCAHLTYQGNVLNSVACRTLRVPIDIDQSTFTCKSQGPTKGSTYLSELNVVFKERSSMISELQHALLMTNFKYGIFFRDANGDLRFMGDPFYDMKVEISDDAGQGSTGTAKADIKFSQVSKIPPIYIQGQIKFGDGIEDLLHGRNSGDLQGYTGIMSFDKDSND